MRRLLFCFLLTFTSLTAFATEPARPKVGLVLSVSYTHLTLPTKRIV